MLKPVFKYKFKKVVIRDEALIYLLSERGQYVLKGRIYIDIAELMDGLNSREDIKIQLKGRYAADEISEVINHMEKKGYITESVNDDIDAAGFWSSMNKDIGELQNSLNNRTVTIKNYSERSCEYLETLLVNSGISPGEDGDLCIVIVDDYTQAELKEFNHKAQETGSPWLLVKPFGTILWIGPYFIPGDTACHECLYDRLAGNREVETTLHHLTGSSDPFVVKGAGIEASINTAYSLLSVEVLKILGGDDSVLKRELKTIDLMSLDIQNHVLTRRPQCSVCGDSSINSGMPLPLKLQNRIKKFTADGGHRIYTPSETLRRFGHNISSLTGVVSDVKPIFQDAGGLVSIFYGGHKLSDGCSNLEELRLCLRNKSTGKGKGELQSKVSAFSEAVERYSALYDKNAYSFWKSLKDVDAGYVRPEELMLISDNQYNNRDAWNLIQGAHQFIPERIDQEKQIEWTPAWSFTENRFRYVPSGLIYLRYPDQNDPQTFAASSNGLAAGNVLEEAILQGFMEVVERDAVSMWWYNRIDRPAVDLESFNDSYFNALTEYYSSVGRDLWVLDLTNDFGIPTFIALSSRNDIDKDEIIYGFGTHFDASIGISRALTEMNQALYLIADKRLEYKKRSNRETCINNWFSTARLEENQHLLHKRGMSKKVSADYENSFSNNLKDDVERCIDITRNLGLDLLVTDLTKPDIGFSVVKVIVPGSREFRGRFAPGRLYDVPVKMGWLEKPLNEEQLNSDCINI